MSGEGPHAVEESSDEQHEATGHRLRPGPLGISQTREFFMVWVLLVTRRWSRLARAFVQLPGAPVRSEPEIIQLLQQRVRPVRAAESTRELDGGGVAG